MAGYRELQTLMSVHPLVASSSKRESSSTLCAFRSLFATLAGMNPEYLWLTGAMQLLAIFVIGPVLSIAIAFAAWRDKPQSSTARRYGMVCAMAGIAAVVLMVFAKWMNADVRTALHFLQVACVLLSGLLLGVSMGCGFGVLLGVLRWHNTRLVHDQQEEQ